MVVEVPVVMEMEVPVVVEVEVPVVVEVEIGKEELLKVVMKLLLLVLEELEVKQRFVNVMSADRATIAMFVII